MKTGAGNNMQLDVSRVIFAKREKGGSIAILGQDDIPKIRSLLRSDMPITGIAAKFGVCEKTMRNFIRRRNICDLGARQRFCNVQASIKSLKCKGDK